MNLPKFWPDSGHWNDGVVSLSILLSLLTWSLVAWRVGSFPLLAAGVLPATLTGFLVGVTLVHLLCTYFGRSDR